MWRCRKFPFLLALCVASFLPLSRANAKGPVKNGAAKTAGDKAFQKVKREFQQKIRNKKPAERIAALRLLDDYPTGDAADLIYVTLLDDHAEEVREAAI